MCLTCHSNIHQLHISLYQVCGSVIKKVPLSFFHKMLCRSRGLVTRTQTVVFGGICISKTSDNLRCVMRYECSEDSGL